MSDPQLSGCYREPLSSDSVRLVRLLPNGDPEAPIQCELFHYPLRDSKQQRHPYEALSYVWGGSEKPQSIIIREPNSRSGQDSTEHEFPVTENLHAALSHLRNHGIERVVWIDAICINQKDEEEKGQQIQLMAMIYALATRVLVWLGPAADDSDKALEAIREVGGKSTEDSSIDEAAQQAVVALLQRPWFRRIWVLQEVAAARHVLIMCGTTVIDGYAFCLGVDSFQGSDLSLEDLQRLDAQVTFLIRGSIFRPDFSMTDSGGRISLGICRLSELVERYHTHEATERRDKVFALLGMSSDDFGKAMLLLDYKVPWDKLLQRLVKHILCEEISVETWGADSEAALIKSKGCVLGWVSTSFRNDLSVHHKTTVEIDFRNQDGKRESIRCELPTSTKSVQRGDILCLLEGAAFPAIVRACQWHFEVILILADLPETLRENIDEATGRLEVREPQCLFPCQFLLIWNLESSAEKWAHQEEQGTFTPTSDWMPNCSADLEDHLERAARLWNVAQVVVDAGSARYGDYEQVEERLNEVEKELRAAALSYEASFGAQNHGEVESHLTATPLSPTSTSIDVVVHLLLAKGGIEAFDLAWTKNRGGGTLLAWAASEGHEAVVEVLLNINNAGIHLEASHGFLPLLLAAEKGHERVVKRLLAPSGDVGINSKSPQSKSTPLIAAATYGLEAVVKLLLETHGVDINCKNTRGMTALLCAAENGHEGVVELLLAHGGVDVDATVDGLTAFQKAAQRGHEGVVKLLLPHSADLHSLLVWVVETRSEVLVKLLLSKDNVDPDKSGDGGTPLSRAACLGYEEMAKLLLATGKVDVNSKDSQGRTPLSLAAGKGHDGVVKLLLSTDNVDVNSKDDKGRTPLIWAIKTAEKGRTDQARKAGVKQLLETSDVDVNAKDNKGLTPLSWAAKRGSWVLAELLLETAKVEIDSKDLRGWTPLMLAIEGEHRTVVKLLLATGRADVNSKANDGYTPLLLARDRERDEDRKYFIRDKAASILELVQQVPHGLY